MTTINPYVSRAGIKLEHALTTFNISVENLVAGDFGCSTGGFTDCLLQHGASKIYAVDTAKGELAWKLRINPQVVVMESTNAMFVTLPEKVDLITIDTAWTKQSKIIPTAMENLKPRGKIIALVKPQYEIPDRLIKGKIPETYLNDFVEKFKHEISSQIASSGEVLNIIQSPITGDKAGNTEFLMLIEKF